MNLWVLDYRMKGIYEMKKGAFTLAEVLLTLAIIGVVAAMTVPSLMTSTEDKKLAAAAKKAYNTLQNAITLKQAQTDLTPADTDGAHLMDFLTGLSDDKVQVLKVTEQEGQTVQTPDGIIMVSSGGQCGSDEGGDGGVGGSHCMVKVDVNGAEGPHFSQVSSTEATTAAGAKLTQLTYSDNRTTTYARANRDFIYFRVNGTNVYPDPSDEVTMRYIKGKRAGAKAGS